MSESLFQNHLISKIKRRWPGAVVLKNDSSYIQGFPDLLVLIEDGWFALECKASENSPVRPNQDYWVDELNSMGFAAFIYPENQKEILDEMEQSLNSHRKARVS